MPFSDVIWVFSRIARRTVILVVHALFPHFSLISYFSLLSIPLHILCLPTLPLSLYSRSKIILLTETNNGGRFGTGYGDQKLGIDTTISGHGAHRRPALLRIQAHALRSDSRRQGRQRRAIDN